MNPSVSVIVPVYNVEMYLDECLDSLVNQTFTDIEIICIDDGSIDSSLEILERYAANDKRVKVFSKENSGPGSTRNYALDRAQGDYLIFVDSDDWLDLSAIETLYKISESKDLDVLLFLLENYDETQNRFYEDNYYNLAVLPESFDGEVFNHRDIEEYMFNLAVVSCNKLYRRSVIERYRIRFPEGVLFEDNPFHYEVMLSSRKMSVLREHFLMRRRRGHSIMADVDQKFLDVIKVSNLVWDVFKKYDVFEEYLKRLMDFKMRYVSMWYGLIEEEFKDQYWKLMYDDFCLIQEDTSMHNKFMNHLSDKLKNFYLSVLESNNYQELDILLLKYKSNLETKNNLNKINREKNNLNKKSKALNSMEKDILNKNAKLIEDIYRADAKNRILDLKHDNFEKYFAEKKAFLDVSHQELIRKQSDFENAILEKGKLFDEMQADFEEYVAQKESELDKREMELKRRQEEFENLILKRERSLLEKEMQMNNEFSRKKEFLELRELELLGVSSEDIRPKVSIIVPIYDYDDSTARCLNSISSQSLKNIEAICIATDDESLAALNEHVKNDSRFKVLCCKNQDVSAVKDYGLQESSGEYVIFLDSEEWLAFDACNDLYMDAKVDNLDLIMFSANDISFKEDNVFDFRKIGSDMFTVPVEDCHGLYRKDSLKGIQFGDEISFFWEAFLSSKSVKIAKNCVYVHNEESEPIHSSNIIAAYDAVFRAFEKQGLLNEFRSDLNNYKISNISHEYSGLDESEKEEFWKAMREDLLQSLGNSGDDLINSLSECNKNFYNHLIKSRSFKELDYLEKYGDKA